jgi:hypothetical protein
MNYSILIFTVFFLISASFAAPRVCVPPEGESLRAGDQVVLAQHQVPDAESKLDFWDVSVG